MVAASRVVTFYSYKGGVGRSMAMSNVGMMLAQWGYKTLVIDWDLEAPGLENYYRDFIDLAAVVERRGLIDLLLQKVEEPELAVADLNWDEYLTKIAITNDTELHLITAGKRDGQYINKVRQFDFTSFYGEHDGGQYLEDLRNYWLGEYEFVLIDSRTGLTDSSGICSIHMPDILVLLFTPNEQSFNGIKGVAKRAVDGQKQIIYDRFRLRTLPIPCRIENAETELHDKWMKKIAEEIKDIIEWLPHDRDNKSMYIITPAQLINHIKIPYKTLYSYGEKLPVAERGTADPLDLGYVYETLAAIIANDLQHTPMLLNSRDGFIKKAKGEEVADHSELEYKVAAAKEEKTKLEEQLRQKTKSEMQLWNMYRRRKSRMITYSVFIGLGLALIAFLISNTFRKTAATGYVLSSSDSIGKARAYSDFVAAYNTAPDQYALPFNLELMKRYYTLDKKYQDLAENIRRQIEENMYLNFFGAIDTFYYALRNKTIKANEYFTDTVSAYGILENLPVQLLQARMDSVLKLKSISNRPDTSTYRFGSDSAGYYVSFLEKGNILLDRLQEYEFVKNKVIVYFTPNFRIRSFEYQTDSTGVLLASNIFAEQASRMRVDLFVCNDVSGYIKLMYQISSILEKSNFNVNRKNFKNPSSNASPYFISGNEIRYNGNFEKGVAKKLGEQLKRKTGFVFSLKPVRTITPNIISIFICENASPQVQGQIKRFP